MSTLDLVPHTPTATANCAFCLAAVAEGDISCPGCGACHHRDCAAEAGTCAVCGRSLHAADQAVASEPATDVADAHRDSGAPATPSSDITPAGWYPDPNDESLARWWDGRSWTDATQPMGTVPVVVPAGGSDESVPAKSRKKKGGWVIGGVIAASVAVVAAIGSMSSSGPVQVAYSVDVAKGCYESSWGYADVSPGASVRVEDGTGTVLGVGVLEGGNSSGYGRCEYTATFDVEPSEDGTYRVTSGNANRGYLSFDENDVHSGTLTVRATLG